ncbi:hypothetical protein [Sphingomonas aerolata]|uniref:hypothetical protein n=1 Tax=Sphingomonas aerolata TaxID=185951 RepID=UPI00141B108C|nr:hypothetical protein [Sphingomonas aerolata]NII58345.1 hypothetical protein [Sphingomonas aerolata]
MLSIRNSADLDRALDAPLEPYLRCLLTLRRDQLVGDTGLDLGEFMHAIVVRVGDTLAQVEAEAGVPIATNLIDGKRLGDAEFEPSFDYVRRCEGWLEAVIILTDDGFALVLLVPDLITVDPSITLLLRRCVAA